VENLKVLLMVVVFIGCIYSAVLLRNFNPNLLRTVGGIFLIVFGALVLKYGDNKVDVDDGKMGRMMFRPENSAYLSKLWKWVVGVLSILGGASILSNKF